MASDVWQLLHGTGTYQEADPDFPPDLATWNDPRRSGGGYAPGQLSHGLALLLWWSGLAPDAVMAAMDPPTGVDLFDALLLKFKDGAVGVASGASTTTGGAPREQIEVRMFGDNGHILLDLEREQLEVYTPERGTITIDLEPGDGLYQCSGPPNALIDLALGKSIENRSPARLGAAVVEIVRAAMTSSEELQYVNCGDGTWRRD
jgi:predicted dehydrogenase